MFPRRLFVPIALAVSALFVGGCGHTNHLAQYNVHGATYLFRAFATSDAARAQAQIVALDTANGAGLLTVVGDSMGRSALQEKVERVRGMPLAVAVSDGITEALKNCLNVVEVHAYDDNPSFFVETTLTKYEIRSYPTEAWAFVSARTRILDRVSGAIVWADKEDEEIPLGGAAAGPGTRHPTVAAFGAGAFNATVLIGMSDDQLRAALAHAAEQAGLAIGETLRGDVADLHQ